MDITEETMKIIKDSSEKTPIEMLEAKVDSLVKEMEETFPKGVHAICQMLLYPDKIDEEIIKKAIGAERNRIKNADIIAAILSVAGDTADFPVFVNEFLDFLTDLIKRKNQVAADYKLREEITNKPKGDRANA